MTHMEIREAKISDAASIAAIYNHYVETSTITFEEEAISVEEMENRMNTVVTQNFPWYVAFERNSLIGYACAKPWKPRTAYRFSAELTAYVAQEHIRKGVGSGLYRRLLPALERRGSHTALAGIALPNSASVTLHERFGFTKVAHLSQVGFKMQRWIDVGYWQLPLNRSK
jgi:L-amino acid N-acyltransferase YncA